MMDEQVLYRAKILSQALPYIKKFHKKTVVIKYGGAAIKSEDSARNVVNDVVLLSLIGIRVVLVHGGGPEINEMLSKVGKQSKFVKGIRYTDEETMEIVQMVLCGKINKKLTQLIGNGGAKAIGFSGLDANIIMAKKLQGEQGEDFGLVGEITSIDPSALNMALEEGYIPVVSTIGSSEEGQVYNINADTAAAHISIALGAEKLILMTDVQGVMKNHKDKTSLISVIRVSETQSLISEGIISGGMIPKVECCKLAINNGVPRTHILDGRIPHSILIEMLSDDGIGTMILQ